MIGLFCCLISLGYLCLLLCLLDLLDLLWGLCCNFVNLLCFVIISLPIVWWIMSNDVARLVCFCVVCWLLILFDVFCFGFCFCGYFSVYDIIVNWQFKTCVFVYYYLNLNALADCFVLLVFCHLVFVWLCSDFGFV